MDQNNAQLWSSDNSPDTEFIKGIKFFIDQGLIIKPDTLTSEQKIPDWIKNNAKWWANNQISDEDYVESIEYLVKKGIIRI